MTTQTCKDRIEGEWAKTRQDLNRTTDEELAEVVQAQEYMASESQKGSSFPNC